ncbi:MAG: hypothetical protein OHK006_04090 [Thermodesulfovibrionales bacterium]
MSGTQGYTITEEDGGLVFRTQRFAADRGSVLHSGIYSRELASMLASFGLAAGLALLLFLGGRKTMAAYALVVLALVGSFPLFLRFVFREQYLETVFSAAAGTAEIFRTGLFRKKKPASGLPRSGTFTSRPVAPLSIIRTP